MNELSAQINDKEHDKMEKRKQDLETAGILYIGRLSPWAREEIYRLYHAGYTVKELSLKFGILP